ncbi:MAG TPA: hypothetical protein PLA65_09830 [Spirochaetota bacterium]|nr:hypothetical protein [Spirochaetota bacterium]HOD13171.1 hypothetical protein [Spirochaetota bacterium]HPG49022.1 hypothetical protein [Spirochaetota bacterium]HPN12349.1 hypothetical protein [Spirochaetota bacterium]
MKYTVVKQFSNGFIDNIFSFIFKWVDCGKMFLEFLWSFLEIWIAFFLIFYNAAMYVYYLFLFFIDRGTESSSGMFRLRGTYSKTSYMPKFEVTKSPTTVPGMYGGAARAAADAVATTASKASEAATQTLTSIRSAAQGMKKSALREFFSSVLDALKALGSFIILPFKKLILLFDRGAALRRQREEDSGENKSLISEYIKEYEQKRR